MRTKMVEKAKVLPRLPSALIRLALKDLERVSKRKNIKVDMDDWVVQKRKKCSVCFAGAVMVGTLGVAPTGYKDPYDCGDENLSQLKALNALRAGKCEDGFSYLLPMLAANAPFPVLDREVPPYTGKGTKFFKAMRQLADDFEKAGF
jgi:hypothetical protein